MKKSKLGTLVDLVFIIVAATDLPMAVKEKDVFLIILSVLLIVVVSYKIVRNTEESNVLAGEIFAAMYQDGLEIVLKAKENESPYIELAAWKGRLKICEELIKESNMPDEYIDSYIKRIFKTKDDIEKIIFALGYVNKGFHDLYVNPELCKKANQAEAERGKEC